jgi:hypothetical protein
MHHNEALYVMGGVVLKIPWFASTVCYTLTG